MSYSVVTVEELDEKVLETWRRTGMVLLVGSYVSTFPPTSLPTGKATSESLWQLILSPNEVQALREDLQGVPFEAIMQCYPNKKVVKSIIRRLYSATRPNQVHRCVVSSLRLGKLQGLITTNYDLAFDALAKARADDIVVVYDEATLRRYRDSQCAVPDAKACFKIHGTADEIAENTIVCDLEAEGRLKDWKREFLYEMVRGRTLVVVGYSGCDFDICPELAGFTKQERVVWLQPSRKSLQPNAERVLNTTSGMLVEGDLEDFLRVTLDPVLTVPTPLPRPVDLTSYFDPILTQGWRQEVLSWMGCGKLLSDCLSDNAPSKFRRIVYAHMGLYRNSVEEITSTLRAATGGTEDQLRLQIDLAGAQFMYGQHVKGWYTLRRVERSLQSAHPGLEDLQALAFETKLMMYMRVEQAARQFRQAWLTRLVKKRAKSLYDTARPILETMGAWGRLQALQQNAERIGVARTDGLSLPYRQGYRSLGLVSMDVIAIRDWVRTKPWKLTPEKERAARDCIAKAEKYGWHHEAWKFHWILLCRGRGDKIRHVRGWWEHFWRTQYSPLARLFHLIVNLSYADATEE
jgi:hypothetical protein